MKLAYVSGPYGAPTAYGVAQNIAKAERVGARLWQKGYAVIIPHKNSAFMDGVVSRDQFLLGDFEIIKRCDLVVMIPGWQQSEGAVWEYEVAKKYGIEIVEYQAEEAAA